MTNPMAGEWRNPLSNGRIAGENVPIERYLAQPDGVKRGDARFVMRSGELRDFMSCPRRWIFRPVEGDAESTKAQTWGSLVDCLLTMPHELETRFTLTPATYPCEPSKKDPRTEKPWSGNSTWCKDWLAQKEDEGFTVIKPHTLADARMAAARLRSDSQIASLIKDARFQVMVEAEYKDLATGIVVPVKTLIDIVPAIDGAHGKSIANLKTCASAAHHVWNKAVFEHGYDMQAGLEMDTYLCASGEDRTDYLHPIQESAPPFEPGRRTMPDAGFLFIGRDRYLAALIRYCQCLKAGEWPGFDDPDPGQTHPNNGWTPAEAKPYMLTSYRAPAGETVAEYLKNNPETRDDGHGITP